MNKIPWFPLVSGAATVLGLIGLGWYESLSREDKAQADGLTADYARKLYGSAVAELTDAQRAYVGALVEANLRN